jgi:predicted alpha/beta-hydrolase family hydrolase
MASSPDAPSLDEAALATRVRDPGYTPGVRDLAALLSLLSQEEEDLARFTERAVLRIDARHAPRLVRETIAQLDSATRPLFIGGKSMGGRIATQVAAADAELPVAGLVLLGYPLHPPAQPQKLRDAHLPRVGRPMLFVQGSRDGFGTPDELAPILARLTPAPSVYTVAGGDHSFKVSRTDPARQAEIHADIQRTIARWVTAGGT